MDEVIAKDLGKEEQTIKTQEEKKRRISSTAFAANALHDMDKSERRIRRGRGRGRGKEEVRWQRGEQMRTETPETIIYPWPLFTELFPVSCIYRVQVPYLCPSLLCRSIFVTLAVTSVIASAGSE